MNDDERVSIVVPIYNVEDYLKKCIKSLVEQTYDNIEILLINDGSTDNSGKIIDQYSKSDNRIKVIHKENGGYGSVLEYAINNMKSNYFLICDPDDWLEKKAVELLIKTMKEQKTDFVVARKSLVYSDGKIQSDKNDFSILVNNKKYEDLTPFLNIPCSPHSKLYKTSFCKNIHFPKKINNTDFLLYQVYLSRIDSAVFIDEPLSNYFIDRPGNSFNEDLTITEKSFISNTIVTDESFKQINRNSDLYNYSIINLCIRALTYLAMINNNEKIDKNHKYRDILNSLINNSKENKKYIKRYFKANTPSKIKCSIKNILYSGMFNEQWRRLLINYLSKKIIKQRGK